MSEVVCVLQKVYAVIAELWCSPRDVNMEEAKRDAHEAIPALASLDEEGAALLSQFLQSSISEEEYIELFELDPRCSLYLGSHVFDEPHTCANAAVSDRNGYMIELLALYRHFGLTPHRKELPDYLPLMVEFLALTAGSKDPVRERFIREYFLPFLPPMRAKLEGLKTPYLYLLEALERLLKRETSTKGVSHG